MALSSASILLICVPRAMAVDVSTQAQLNTAVADGNSINITSGDLALSSGQTLSSTADLAIAAGASLDTTAAGSQQVGSLAGGGTLTVGTTTFVFGADNTNTAFSGTVDLSNQAFDSPSGTLAKIGTGTLTIDGASFNVGSTYIAQGAMAQTSGTTSINYLAVGEGTGSTGSLDVSGGTLTIGTALQVGDFGGQGAVNQTGGTVLVTPLCGVVGSCASINIGNQGGIGTYAISDGELDIVGGNDVIGRVQGRANASSSGELDISGSGEVDISGAAHFVLGNTDTLSSQAQGAINQTGGVLRVENDSILFLSGPNSLTDVYNLDGGTLQIGGSSLQGRYNNTTSTYAFNLGGGTIQVMGSALVTNVNAALTSGVSTIDTNGLGATFGGILSGNGGLAKVGAGTLVLTGTNSYAGGTDLNAGIIQVGADANLGAATGQLIFDGGTLQYANGFSSARSITLNTGGGIIDTNANNATLSGAIGGAGGLTKTGAGALTLSGASNYSGATLVNAGTLQAGATNVLSAISAFTLASGTTLNLGGFDNTIGSLAGSGSVALGAATLTAGGDGASTDFSGTIDGTGGLVKSGDGTLTLTGTSSYVGPTTVAAGTLDVNGTLASIATVDSGAILKGNGTLGGLAVASGGVVAPGNSIGTLNIAGNVAFASGSIYQVEANAAGAADKISASGVTTLGGGHVQVLAQSGNYTAQTYTILTSAAGVDGTFTDATSDLAFLTPTLSYDPDDVFLTLTRNGVFFSDMAETRNQRGVAGALDAAPTGDALVTAVGGQNPAGARQAFDALSGEIYASTASSLITDSVYFREAILGRLRQASFAGASDATAALGLGGPALAYADTAPASVGNVPFPIRSSRAPDLTWWSVGTGAWGQFDGDGNAAGVERNLAGYFTGVDRRFGDNWLAGLAAGYTNSSLSIAARASGADINTAHFAAYAAGNYDAWNFRSGAAFSWSDISTNRMVLFPGFSEATNTNYNAGTTQVFGEVGYARSLGNIAIEPFAGAAYVHLGTAGFTEAGQTAALSGANINEDVGYSSLGLRLATNIALESGQVLTPHASAYWQHAFGDVTPVQTLSFLSTGTGFSTAGVPLAQNTAVIDTGLDLALTRNTKIGVSYFGQLGSNVQDNAVKGDFLWRF
ncbi:MAG: autotransporter domain-containing protein [Methylovirgula sp.]|uniref:autotransporter outer membrane beta-barrel domain-containing protein n=1 Tax=Methylovirgula sp. TaxID=1978224 RepID=UPI00307672B1